MTREPDIYLSISNTSFENNVTYSFSVGMTKIIPICHMNNSIIHIAEWTVIKSESGQVAVSQSGQFSNSSASIGCTLTGTGFKLTGSSSSDTFWAINIMIYKYNL